ncbi:MULTISPECIES: putative zinc-binding protein [Haloplanus]|jgi:uncharacterized metal-binding protein|uniref:putative zinc-binding protein n=1 Tax=Haloplanus TaxID=376170 RepID=UPI0022B87482|nr:MULTISPECIES: putative zinc-binding protein [Haloplanus]
MTDSYDDLPLVYACSGCSSAARMANDLAVRLDHERLAEMSCIAGVGGDVEPLVATATADRPTSSSTAVRSNAPGRAWNDTT